MEEKTSTTTSIAEETATATTSAEETTASTVATTASQAECELPTVDGSAEAESSTTANSSTEARTADFSIPLGSLDSLNKLTAFVGELYTYSYLLNKSTGMTEPSLYIDSRMCDDLAEAITADEFLTVMKEFLTTKDIEYVTGLELRKDQLVFTCFQNLQETTGMKKAATSLFNLISKSITEKTKEKKMNLHKVEVKQPENEKFAFRSWLTKLGWKGAEGKAERNLLYRNLNGNTAFCTEESKIRWEAKHKKSKRTEPTVSEAVSTAEDESEEAEDTVAETAVEAVAV